MDDDPVEKWFSELSVPDQRRLVHTVPEPLTGGLWIAVRGARGRLDDAGVLSNDEVAWLSEAQFRLRFDDLDRQVNAAAFEPESVEKAEREDRWQVAATQFESLFGPIP